MAFTQAQQQHLIYGHPAVLWEAPVVTLPTAAIVSTSTVTAGLARIRVLPVAIVSTTLVTATVSGVSVLGPPRKFVKTRRRSFSIRTATTPIS